MPPATITSAVPAGSGLRRSIREEKLSKPNLILKRLNHIIKTSLQQDKEHTKSDDGMDAAICCFDNRTETVYFSGARLPLYVMDREGLTVIKGDKMSIGYVSSDLSRDFSVHEIDNQHRDKRFYMTTDGFTDQIDSTGSNRLGRNRLKQLILEHHDKPFGQQAEIFKATFETHRGNRELTDDVTVAGFMFESME
jgi:serine phosphatase RsbU (regulator of sigma subunit)